MKYKVRNQYCPERQCSSDSLEYRHKKDNLKRRHIRKFSNDSNSNNINKLEHIDSQFEMSKTNNYPDNQQMYILNKNNSGKDKRINQKLRKIGYQGTFYSRRGHLNSSKAFGQFPSCFTTHGQFPTSYEPFSIKPCSSRSVNDLGSRSNINWYDPTVSRSNNACCKITQPYLPETQGQSRQKPEDAKAFVYIGPEDAKMASPETANTCWLPTRCCGQQNVAQCETKPKNPGLESPHWFHNVPPHTQRCQTYQPLNRPKCVCPFCQSRLYSAVMSPHRPTNAGSYCARFAQTCCSPPVYGYQNVEPCGLKLRISCPTNHPRFEHHIHEFSYFALITYQQLLNHLHQHFS